MAHPRLLIGAIGSAVIAGVVGGPCHAEQPASTTIYEALKQKAATHGWRTLMVGWDRLVLFDFGFRGPAIVYQLQRGPSGYYEADVIGGILSPDASKIAFGQEDHKSRKTSLKILDIASRSTKNLLETYRFGGVAWSPDGQQIAYVGATAPDAQQAMYLYDLRTKQGRVLLREGHLFILSQAWSPDGRQLVYELSQADGKVQTLTMVYDLVSKTSRQLATSGKWATWSPNGDWIAYQAFNEQGLASIRLISPDGKREITLVQDTSTGVGALVSSALWSPDGAYLLYDRMDLQEPAAAFSHAFELATNREEALPKEIYWAHSFAGKK